MSARTGKISALVLWIAAPLLCGLSLYRPFHGSAGRAAGLPASLPGFELVADHPLTRRQMELLGTEDATWRTYRDAAGHEVYLVAVFHEENWRSVHPPQICLEGSNMTIVEDSAIELDGASVGRLRTVSRDDGRGYLGLYVYGAPGLWTGSYAEFAWHHAPRAVLRRSVRGCLLRVETWIGADGVEPAEARCRAFLRALAPAAKARLALEGSG